MAGSERDNQDVLRRAREGDAEAFAGLFEELRPVIHRVAYRKVGPDDCEDVVMETYLKAWRALPNFQGRSSLKTWLCRIASNCSLDWLRRRQRHEGRHVHWDDEEDGSPAERLPDTRGRDPRRHAELHDLGTRLDQAIAKLSDHHRVTLLLREVDGLSYSEVAAATGVRIGTVMSRLFYARRKVRRFLEECES